MTERDGWQELSDDMRRAILRPLSREFPTVDAVLAEMARLSAELTLPKGTVHVISDVHGEDKKLRHVINNASGTLRPLVEKLFGPTMNAEELENFLKLLFYPKETLQQFNPSLTDELVRREFAKRTLHNLFELVRVLSKRYTLKRALAVFPEDYRELLQELLHEDETNRGTGYSDTMLETLVRQQRIFRLIRFTVRLVRNLTIEELIIAGDCWDRGPRGDHVLDYISRLPNVAITWGNHDVAWLGASVGQEALIAHVLRISIRYRRLSQLEEGYGITMQPLERLVRDVYANDPAECFKTKGTGLREEIMMRRMQKAAAIMQFKLEGQTIARNPHYDLDHRRLLHQINLKTGTVMIDGIEYPLKDTHFPTLDPDNPYELSEAEQACMRRLKRSFLSSQTLWDHMRFLVERGAMYLLRDDHLIFHGCLAVDERGAFLPFLIDGKLHRGRELFDAIQRAVIRLIDIPRDADRDLMWYLWCGPRSPLFGKDRICTFENDLVAAPETHVETKNPYFQLIHDVSFCDRILAEFGADTERGLIVNGHVPVKIEKGESPLKKSGKAITIDGAFSEAYGDHGYTLVLEPEQTTLAEHHHFESVEAAVRDGVDIIPTITVVRDWGGIRKTSETEKGVDIRADMALLERLLDAYRDNFLSSGFAASTDIDIDRRGT